jgi:hypothetical protein
VLLLVSSKKSLSDSSFDDDEFSSGGSGSGAPASQAIRIKMAKSTTSSTDEKPIHFARNPAMSMTGTSYSTDADTVMDISSARPSTEKVGRGSRLSDDSFV